MDKDASITFRLPEEQKAEIEQIIKNADISIGKAMREAITEYVEKLKREGEIKITLDRPSSTQEAEKRARVRVKSGQHSPTKKVQP